MAVHCGPLYTLVLAAVCQARIFMPMNLKFPYKRSVFDLEIIPIFHPHYHTHSGNTSRPVNLAVVRWLVSYEDLLTYSYFTLLIWGLYLSDLTLYFIAFF